MTLEEAQKTVDEWIKTYGVRYFSELTNMAVLTEEVGELARIRARTYGVQGRRKNRLGRRNGRRALGVALSGQPNGCRPDGSVQKESGEENQPRQGKT